MRIMDKPVGDYVKTYRSLLNWEWYHDLPVRVLFQHMMLEANWLPGRFEGQDIPPGSFPTSADKLAGKSGLTRQAVRTALDKLKSTGEITIESTSRFSVVTIANWDKYQGDGKQATRRTTRQATNDQPTINTRSTTIEEGKKERREEESARVDVLVWPTFAGAKCKAKWSEFIAYRIQEKTLRYKSPKTEQRALDLCTKYFPSGPLFVNGLDHTMAKGWKYPVDPGEYKYPTEQEAQRESTPMGWLTADGK